MFQACVSISVCIFYVFMNIYTGYVCINGHTAGGKKKKKDLPTYLPYFSVARYSNTTTTNIWPNVSQIYGCLFLSGPGNESFH